MFTIRTAVRVLSAAVATLAVAAGSQAGEHKPSQLPGKPVPNQPSKPTPAESVKALRSASSGQATKIAPEVNKPNGYTYQKIESVKSPRDVATGYSAAKTQAPGFKPVDPKVVESVKSPRDASTGLPSAKRQATRSKSGNVPAVEAATGVKPGFSLGKPTAYNDSGTRSGGSLVASGIIDMGKGLKAIATGNTESGFKLFAQGAKRVQTGSNGDPADNGKPLSGGKGEGTQGEGGGEGEGGTGK